MLAIIDLPCQALSQPLLNLLMKKLIALALSLSLLGACALPGLYTPTIVQGNIVDADKVQQLELGMDANQVLFLLGTPLLRDTFNPERWDYLYLESTSAGEVVAEQRGYLLFQDGALQTINMDDFLDG